MVKHMISVGHSVKTRGAKFVKIEAAAWKCSVKK